MPYALISGGCQTLLMQAGLCWGAFALDYESSRALRAITSSPSCSRGGFELYSECVADYESVHRLIRLYSDRRYSRCIDATSEHKYRLNNK